MLGSRSFAFRTVRFLAVLFVRGADETLTALRLAARFRGVAFFFPGAALTRVGLAFGLVPREVRTVGLTARLEPGFFAFMPQRSLRGKLDSLSDTWKH